MWIDAQSNNTNSHIGWCATHGFEPLEVAEWYGGFLNDPTWADVYNLIRLRMSQIERGVPRSIITERCCA